MGIGAGYVQLPKDILELGLCAAGSSVQAVPEPPGQFPGLQFPSPRAAGDAKASPCTL